MWDHTSKLHYLNTFLFLSHIMNQVSNENFEVLENFAFFPINSKLYHDESKNLT